MEGVVKMDNNYLVDIQHERLSFFTSPAGVKKERRSCCISGRYTA